MPTARYLLDADRRLSEQGDLPDGPGFDRVILALADESGNPRRVLRDVRYQGKEVASIDAPGFIGRSLDLHA